MTPDEIEDQADVEIEARMKEELKNAAFIGSRVLLCRDGSRMELGFITGNAADGSGVAVRVLPPTGALMEELAPFEKQVRYDALLKPGQWCVWERPFQPMTSVLG